jgi:uridine kinase
VAITASGGVRPRFTTNIRDVADSIAELARTRPRSERAPLVAVSGIDASGKGFVAGRLTNDLAGRGLNVALLHLDPWHYPQSVRLAAVNPGAHFYHHAFRWDELFHSLVEPLRRDRAIRLTATLIEIARDEYYAHTFTFTDVDIVLLEGIFLLRRDLRARYDLAWWVECSFETAMQRAIARNQEGLPEAELVADFARIYFPAQRHHFAVDDPIASADGILLNDER